MITKDQPKCFPNNLKVALSSKSDGTILNKSLGVHHPEIVKNRQVFLRKSWNILRECSLPKNHL